MASTAPKTKMPNRRKLSNRSGLSLSQRIKPAPIRASLELLTNQQSTIRSGMPASSSTARWAGSAASRTIHQERTGVSSRPASRIALGGHSVETGCGWSVSAMPIFAPT